MNHDRASTLAEIESHGVTAYPHRFEPTASPGDLARAGEADETEAGTHRVMGRIRGVRRHGGWTFLDITDHTGTLQAGVKAGETDVARLAALVQVGDVVGVVGPLFRTRTGQLTVRVIELVVLAKCLQSWPDRRHGIADTGRLRAERHVDLMLNPATVDRFITRSRIISSIRSDLERQRFVEVETPVLQPVYGGAEARPFTTSCAATDSDLFLRISPELYLKRLIVGGMDRVFEIGKNFRNEGLSAKHHPEFTALEAYAQGWDYNDMMDLCEALIAGAARAVEVDSTITSPFNAQGHQIDVQAPFRRISMLDAIQGATGLDMSELDDPAARHAVRDLGLAAGDDASWDACVLAVFESRVEPRLVQPTFVTDYPADVCPLTKRHRDNPRLAERFELFIDSVEFANAYTELTDPREQRRQFDLQARRKAAGDELAHPPDWAFVEALEWGMPPTGGLGIGIDRLVMLVTGAGHIQDVVLFPLRMGVE